MGLENGVQSGLAIRCADAELNEMNEKMNNITATKNWWESGIKSGWIEIYEQEAVRFLEQEFGKLSETEKLCIVFCSLFYKAGHTALPLHLSPQKWAELLDIDGLDSQPLPEEPVDDSILKAGYLVAQENELKPFIIHNDQLSFQKNRKQELDILNWFLEKEKSSPAPLITSLHMDELSRLFPETAENSAWQKVAVALSLIKPALIISGGPGTGKTTTVARILSFLQRVSEKPLKVALAAPTGKAAGRMGEALFSELKKMGLSSDDLIQFPKEAKTVHRLLSGTEERGLLPPVEKKMLQHDLVIVDEASMIDLNLMHRLLTHLSNKTRLILLGDKDQLASVEAGSVFADLCQKRENSFSSKTLNLLRQIGVKSDLPEADQPGIDDSIIYLTKSFRFGPDSGIGTLAESVKTGELDSSVILKHFQSFDDLSYHTFEFQKEDISRLTGQVIERLHQTNVLNQPEELLKFWKKSAWLSVLRRGLTGSERLNRLVESQIAIKRVMTIEDGWYHGRPVIISKNDYNLGIFNGDLGVCVQDSKGEFWIYVESGSEIKRINPGRMMNYEPAYFLTVHKSQGSEFNRVNLLLPGKDTPILTRELLYTAITRARQEFSLYGRLELFQQGISRKTERFTGLRTNHQL